MSDKTKIQWADATFNPWIGCTKVSPGCLNCYAENTTRARVLRKRGHETWGKGAKRSRTAAATWEKPVAWHKRLERTLESYPDACSSCGQRLCGVAHDWVCPSQYKDGKFDPTVPRCGGRITPNVPITRPRVFPSLCDWLDDEVPIEWLADFLKLIYDTPNLDWLLLTKRPENWASRIEAALQFIESGDSWDSSHPLLPLRNWLADWFVLRKAPANVWIVVSVEDQIRADERIPALFKIPAVLRGLSCEPLLGSVDLTRVMFPTMDDHHGNKRPKHPENVLTDGISDHARETYPSLRGIKTTTVDWVIIGGESGSSARPCNVEWVRSIVAQCKAAGVAVFVKQLGKMVIDRNDAGFEGDEGDWPMNTGYKEIETGYQGAPVQVLLKDKKGGDMAEWPEDLRVREFPQIPATK